MKKFKNKKKTDLGGAEELYSDVPNTFIPTGETGFVQHAADSDELLSNAVQAEGTVPVTPTFPFPYENIDAEIAKIKTRKSNNLIQAGLVSACSI